MIRKGKLDSQTYATTIFFTYTTSLKPGEVVRLTTGTQNNENVLKWESRHTTNFDPSRYFILNFLLLEFISYKIITVQKEKRCVFYKSLTSKDTPSVVKWSSPGITFIGIIRIRPIHSVTRIKVTRLTKRENKSQNTLFCCFIKYRKISNGSYSLREIFLFIDSITSYVSIRPFPSCHLFSLFGMFL